MREQYRYLYAFWNNGGLRMIRKSLLLAAMIALTGCQAVHDAIEYDGSDSLDYSAKQKFQPGGYPAVISGGGSL